MTLRLLAVHAHPDDESSKGAATMAKYLGDGVEVMVATCTGGERGDVLNPKLDRPEIWENLPAIRREEMAASAALIGFQHEWLGFVDSGMPDGDPPAGSFAATDVDEAAAPLVAIIRRFRPHVVLTYDENGGYPHPDHIQTHRVTMRAFEAANDPAQYPDAGEPWQPQKLYYFMTYSRKQFEAIHEAMVSAGLESEYNDWFGDGPDPFDRVTTQVECAEYFAVRDDALRAHATQIDPDGPWFAAPLELKQRVWPTEDYELARSLVDVTTPETDLFSGLRDKE